jgi:hypothetical protein
LNGRPKCFSTATIAVGSASIFFFEKDVAISVDNADADGFERYVEAGEVLHDPLPMKLCGQMSRDTPLAWWPAYSIYVLGAVGSIRRRQRTAPNSHDESMRRFLQIIDRLALILGL